MKKVTKTTKNAGKINKKTEKIVEYNPEKVEEKWHKTWLKNKVYEAKDFSKKKKYYSLMEFPYPSGEGLHTGHVRGYTAMDVISRKRRMEGYNVLFPIGYDAFGLPTENYAIKTGLNPEVITKRNTTNFKKQFQSLGFSFDWSREINTTDPKYYKWTQWIFLQFLKHNLAYKAKMTINWCPKDKIGLANEEVINGCCERCGTKVEKREKEQWMLKITAYADKLDKDLEKVDYLEKIKLQQKNWIGKSEGAEIEFKLISDGLERTVKVFTTRPDTLFGVTYIVLAPETAEKFIKDDSRFRNSIKNIEEVEKYIQDTKNKSELDRTDAKREKTGIEIRGLRAINPGSGEEVSVWIADYVLADYGTGAVMAVPAHDERDFEFASKYSLPTKEVVIERIIDKSNPHVEGKELVFRDAVIAVVRNPKTDKYLCLKWKKHPWTTFVMGGIENGEDPVEAAKREIEEETGYKNVRLVKVLRDAQSEFFAAHKNVNRVAHTRNILFELENEERVEISGEEKDIHEVVWMSLKEIENTNMTHSEMSLILDGIYERNFVFTESGVLVNSGKFSGKNSLDVKKDITESVKGKWVMKYKLRDWVFSRQRYWGEPIPVIHCDRCGVVPVPEKDLPVKLPKVKNYQPTDNGESPLSNIKSWVNVKCPKCKGKAQRETDTMPNWAGSSWYFLRYIDPKNSKKFADPKKLKYWMPVDWYNGGMEHTTLHLLYSRFWNKFLFDIGVVPFSEPYKKRTSHGLILAEGGEKMSKSKGNVVNPDSVVKVYGADTLRMYEMFMGPFDQAIPWDEKNIVGVRRFLERVWKMGNSISQQTHQTKNFRGPRISSLALGQTIENSLSGSSFAALETLLHKTIKKVTEDIETMSFNTAISSMMIYLNELEKFALGVPEVLNFASKNKIFRQNWEMFLKILSPFAPHITEEIWHNLGNKTLIVSEPWPKFDPKKMKEERVKIAVQVSGKVRAEMEIDVDLSEEEVKKMAKELEAVDKWLSGKEIEKEIYVKNRLVNIVLKP